MSDAKSPANRSSVTSISRALSVLDLFRPGASELTLTQLSTQSGIPLTTVHRLTRQLMHWGALEQTAQGAYRIGLKLWEIGSLAPRGPVLRDVAMPFLEDLHAATRQNVHLAVPDGSEALLVEQISARGAVGVVSGVRSRLPLHATSSGLVFLAWAESSFLEGVLAEPLTRYTPSTVVDAAIIRRILGEVRKSRSAVCDGYLTEDSRSIGSPVLTAAGTVVAALAVVVPRHESAHRYVPAVIATARALSRAIGGAAGLR